MQYVGIGAKQSVCHGNEYLRKRENYYNSNNSDQNRDIKEDDELHTRFICE